MECKKASNARFCNCTYPGCEKHGICCECLHYHLGLRQLPACCFPKDVERTYDRTFERFAGLVSTGKGHILTPPPINELARGRPSESCGERHPARTRRVGPAQSKTVRTV